MGVQLAAPTAELRGRILSHQLFESGLWLFSAHYFFQLRVHPPAGLFRTAAIRTPRVDIDRRSATDPILAYTMPILILSVVRAVSSSIIQGSSRNFSVLMGVI